MANGHDHDHSLKYKNPIRRMANFKKLAIHFKIGHSLILAIREDCPDRNKRVFIRIQRRN